MPIADIITVQILPTITHDVRRIIQCFGTKWVSRFLTEMFFKLKIITVSWGDVTFIPIVSVEWPVVGRPAWCHILGEKKVSTLSHVLPNLYHNIRKLAWSCFRNFGLLIIESVFLDLYFSKNFALKILQKDFGDIDVTDECWRHSVLVTS